MNSFEMLKDYLVENNKLIHSKDGSSITGFTDIKDTFIVHETDESCYYHENHTVTALDLLTWLHSKLRKMS